MSTQELHDALTAIRALLLNREYLKPGTRALGAFDALIVKLRRAALKEQA